MTVTNLGNRPLKLLSPEDELRKLLPLIEMQEQKGFQIWIQTVEFELELIEKWSWRAGGQVPKMATEANEVGKLMSELGATWPTTKEEMFQLWGNFRAVVNYWRSKLEYLKGRRERAEELKRAIQQRQARRREKDNG